MPTTPGIERSFLLDSIGPAASHVLSGNVIELRVHSVFASSLNLSVAGSELLVLLSGPAGLVYPHSLALNQARDFGALRLEVGDRGRLEDSAIRFDAAGGRVVLRLERARRRQRHPLPFAVPCGPVFEACVGRLAEFQLSLGCDLRISALIEGSDPATSVGEGLNGRARSLGAAAAPWLSCSAAGAGSQSELGRAVASLVGRGGGLTPSGDDFLCGFIAGARCARSLDGSDAMAAFDAALREAVEESMGSTGKISASLLGYALLAFWPVPLSDLADALAAGREFDSLRALDELCGLGHSSGADIATGFLYGLRAPERAQERSGTPTASHGKEALCC